MNFYHGLGETLEKINNDISKIEDYFNGEIPLDMKEVEDFIDSISEKIKADNQEKNKIVKKLESIEEVKKR